MKNKVRALMILNEINVDIAKTLPGDKFNPIYEKIQEVQQMILDEMFPIKETINKVTYTSTGTDWVQSLHHDGC